MEVEYPGNTHEQHEEKCPSHFINAGGSISVYNPSTHFAVTIPLKFKLAFETILKTLDQKGSIYNIEPLDYVDPLTILHQVRLKVERALQVRVESKQIDDILDTCCYSIRLLQRLLVFIENRERMKIQTTQNRIKERDDK